MSLDKEIQSIRSLMEKKADKDMKPILQGYKRSLDRVRAEIAQIYVQHATSDGTLQISKRQRYTVLKELEKQLLAQARELGHIDVGHTTKILSDVYEESFYRTAYTLDKGLKSEVNFAILKKEFVEAAVNAEFKGERFSSRIWASKENMVNSLRNKVERAMIDGTDVRKLSKEIQTTFETSAFNSKRLIFTEVARVTSEAQKKSYEESGLVQKLLWDSTLDERTSEICEERHGQLYDIDDAPELPAHPFCRSCLIPVVEGWQPTARDNYNAWKESKGIDD